MLLCNTHGSLAQLVEQLAFNQLVAGSNPARPTTFLHVYFFYSLGVIRNYFPFTLFELSQGLKLTSFALFMALNSCPLRMCRIF